MSNKDIPFDECLNMAIAQHHAGGTFLQKFTCSHCGSRQTMPTPNKFYTEGLCGACHHLTNIKSTGCGFMLIFTNDPITLATILAQLEATDSTETLQ